MSRSKHPQEVHFGVKNKLRREGKIVIWLDAEQKRFDSRRQAKRFMRTGRAGRG